MPARRDGPVLQNENKIQESTRRHWSRVRAGLRRRRVGRDLEGGYQHIGIPLPEVPDIADVASPEVPPVHYSCGVQRDDGRVTGKFDRRAWKRVNNIREEGSTNQKKRPDTRTVKLQTPE